MGAHRVLSGARTMSVPDWLDLAVLALMLLLMLCVLVANVELPRVCPECHGCGCESCNERGYIYRK
jgi:hypothetical protein